MIEAEFVDLCPCQVGQSERCYSIDAKGFNNSTQKWRERRLRWTLPSKFHKLFKIRKVTKILYAEGSNILYLEHFDKHIL